MICLLIEDMLGNRGGLAFGFGYTLVVKYGVFAPVVPGALIYSFAEGLITPSMQGTGLAFLGAELKVASPTFVDDTIHVECEVIERRPTSKPGRGLVRTRNSVINQDGKVVLAYTPLRMMRMQAANETKVH